ncbi:MAG: hypothetical protein KDI63_17410 [Gammaproteobacteria bacterium]|nr:hypothetical protein [Gammaproteobacteria bacterium]
MNIRKLVPGLLLVLFLAGCTLPNLKPFADATAELHAAVVETDSAVRLTLTEAGAESEAERLGQELALRIAALSAVVNYSDSLAQIAAAGKSGSESAGNLSDALNGFLGALSAPTLPSNYIALAKSLYGLVAEVRAARSFSRAVETADPAIQGMAQVLIADFGDLEALLAQSLVPVQQALLDNNDNHEIVDYRMQLERRRRQLEVQLSGNTEDAGTIRSLKEINDLIDMTRDRYEPLAEQLAEIAQRTNRQILLVRASKTALRQWADIHGELGNSIAQGISPNTRLLISTVIETRKLINEGGAGR